MDFFKNLFWTRIIDLDHHRADENKSWPIAPDVADAHDALFSIGYDELPELVPHFDPKAFVKENPKPQVGSYRLSQDRLRQIAIDATNIRR